LPSSLVETYGVSVTGRLRCGDAEVNSTEVHRVVTGPPVPGNGVVNWARDSGSMVAVAQILLPVGQEIEVRCHFNCSWVRGFVVADVVVEDGQTLYRIKRSSDGAVLPALFPEGYVRDGETRLFT
jgi:hypothetical protein